MRNLTFFIFLIWFGFVQAQGTLQFNQVKLVSAQETVPVGKVWKVENVYVTSVVVFQASSGSGSCTGTCNGGTTKWNSFTTTTCPTQAAFESGAKLQINSVPTAYNSNSPLWLPAGTSLEGVVYPCSSSAGFFNGTVNNVNYSCHCPVNTGARSTISVIEFNVIP